MAAFVIGARDRLRGLIDHFRLRAERCVENIEPTRLKHDDTRRKLERAEHGLVIRQILVQVGPGHRDYDRLGGERFFERFDRRGALASVECDEKVGSFTLILLEHDRLVAELAQHLFPSARGDLVSGHLPL